jgi:hypothetical protein
MPIVVLEKEKKDVRGKKEVYDVKQINIESSTVAVIETISAARATVIKRVLDFCIHSSGLNGEEFKLNFTVKQMQNWLKRSDNKLLMAGDLSKGFYYMKENFISGAMLVTLIEEIDELKNLLSAGEKICNKRPYN